MSTIKALHTSEIELLKREQKVKTLQDGINYVKDVIGFLHNVLLFKERNNVGEGTKTMFSGKKFVFVFKQTSELKDLKEQYEFVLKRMEKLFHEEGDSSGWNAKDFTKTTIMRLPALIIKKGGYYDSNGYRNFTDFFLPTQGKYVHVVTEKSNLGYFFKYNGVTNYYVKFDQGEEPKPTPAKKRSGSKTLLGRTGHGLPRLLAEAKDPPVIEFRGQLESLKGFAKRALKQHPEITSSTTSFHWGKVGKREKISSIIFSFKSVKDRTKFLQSTKQTLPEYRVGNLSGWYRPM